MRKRAAGGLSAGPERSEDELGSLPMKTGSVMCVLVGDAGREDGSELYKALGSASVGSMLGTLAQVAMILQVDEECARNNDRC